MKKHTGLVAALLSVMGNLRLQGLFEAPRYRGGARTKNRVSGNEAWRDAHPGQSLDMKRYAARYRSVPMKDVKYPFSERKGRA